MKTILFACSLALAAEAGGTPLPVRTIVVSASRDGAARSIPATLVADQRATISTRLSAAVRAVAVDEGGRVRAGQLLVSLADADLHAQLRGARAALAAADLQQARLTALLADRAATPSELDAARAQRAQAEAAARVLETSLQYTSIRAPFAGRVQSKRVSAGDLVSPGQPLLELEGAGLELQATLSAEESAGLSPGQRLAFESDGQRGSAEVIALSAGGDPISHRQLLRARVRGPSGELRSGGFARLFLPAGERPVLWVPRAALVERGDLTGVFVAHQGRAELRWLAIGEADGDRVAVRAGLESGEVVIADPAAASDGQPIEVARGR
jgi:RND family efflux transporter MFP subunit